MFLPYKRGGLRFYLILLALLAGRATPSSIAWGIPFLLAGIALHFWAKGCLHQNREVTTSGPYRFVRHPFYLANAFLDVGIGVMSGWWVLLVALPFWWLGVYIPTMRREEARLTNLFGAAYTTYRDQVPMLIPYRRPLAKSVNGFSWRNPNLARTELPRTFRFLSYPLIFLIAHGLQSQGIVFLFSPTVFDVLSLVMCVTLYAMVRELKQHFKYQRPILASWMIRDAARLAILIGVIAIGLFVKKFEIENEWVILSLGFPLLGLSLVARTVIRQEPAIADALTAIGYAVICELMWFAILLIPLYVAIILDRRFLVIRRRAQASKSRRLFRLAQVCGYGFVLIGGVALYVAKDFLL
jgi:hypothetical protein